MKEHTAERGLHASHPFGAIGTYGRIHAVALHFAYYNFCKIRQPLHVTPAMHAGLAKTAWSVEELVGLSEHHE